MFLLLNFSLFFCPILLQVQVKTICKIVKEGVDKQQGGANSPECNWQGGQEYASMVAQGIDNDSMHPPDCQILLILLGPAHLFS